MFSYLDYVNTFSTNKKHTLKYASQKIASKTEISRREKKNCKIKNKNKNENENCCCGWKNIEILL